MLFHFDIVNFFSLLFFHPSSFSFSLYICGKQKRNIVKWSKHKSITNLKARLIKYQIHHSEHIWFRSQMSVFIFTKITCFFSRTIYSWSMAKAYKFLQLLYLIQVNCRLIQHIFLSDNIGIQVRHRRCIQVRNCGFS